MDCSVRYAIWLKNQGIGSKDIVTVCSHNQFDTYIPMFATFYVGAIYNAWNDKINLSKQNY